MSQRPPGPICNNWDCPCAVPPSGGPCDEFKDFDDKWCAECLWEEHDHE